MCKGCGDSAVFGVHQKRERNIWNFVLHITTLENSPCIVTSTNVFDMGNQLLAPHPLYALLDILKQRKVM